MIKALIFDCWGTLFTNTQRPHPFEVFAQKLGHEISDREFLKLFEDSIMTNNRPVSENITSLLSKLNIDDTPNLINDLTDIVLGSLKAQTAYDDTIEVLNNLKKDYRLILLSNTFIEGFTNLKNNYPNDNLFELIVLSYEENIIKPNKKLYEKILNRSGLNKNEVIMIGDNYHDDVLVANEVGIKSILLDRRGRYPDILDHKIHGLNEINQQLMSAET